MRIGKRVLFGLGAFLTALLMCVPLTVRADDDAADKFQGVWRVKMTPNDDATHDGAKAFDEAMMFENNELMAENFAFYGFEPGAYASTNDSGTAFESTLDSRTQGSLTWTGTINGNSIQGTLTWTKDGGKVWVFNFSGTKASN